MLILFWIIVAFLIFSIIILVHEFGHFKSARFFWVKVEEFWLWIPPKAKKLFKDKTWTIYTLNWLPLGWFVRLKWEDARGLKNVKDKDALVNKPMWQKSIIILAWVFMNFVLSFVIFTLLFLFWVKPIWINTKIDTDLDVKLIPNMQQAIESWILVKNPWILLSPVEWSIAQKAWIVDWDILLKINWKKISSPENMIEIVWNNPSNNLILTLKDREIIITPSSEWKIWAYVWENIEINRDFKYKYSFLGAIKHWYLETQNQILLTFKALWTLFQKLVTPENNKEREEAINSLKWPIWMVDFISNTVSAGIIFLLIIWAIISINLWVFNLLPIPALDWWRFVFIIINSTIKKLFWKKIIGEKVEWLIHVSFFILLIALSIIIGYNDINNIVNR